MTTRERRPSCSFSDPLVQYDKDKGKWTDAVAAPACGAWCMMRWPSRRSSRRSTASTRRSPAIPIGMRCTSLVLSLVVILAYIWFRFGNLKYGTATVVAMLHDTLIVIGAVGLAHLVFHLDAAALVAVVARTVPPESHARRVDPDCDELFSMIDTIVVFDRIRENRGKFGHLDRKVVNDSINQTLSRTLADGRHERDHRIGDVCVRRSGNSRLYIRVAVRHIDRHLLVDRDCRAVFAHLSAFKQEQSSGQAGSQIVCRARAWDAF